MTTISDQDFNLLAKIITEWLDEDTRNYAALADVFRNAGIAEHLVGVVVLELMSAEKLADWRDVLATLRQRSFASDTNEGFSELPVLNEQNSLSVWDRSIQKWELRYHDAGEGWALGNSPVVDVIRAVKYYRAFFGERPAQAIDLGAGDGRNAIFLAQSGFDLTVVEAAKTGLEHLDLHLQVAGLNATLVHADLRDYEIPQNLDLLISSYVLHLLPDPMQHLLRWQAAVRPGGIAMVSSRGAKAFDPPDYFFPEPGFLKHSFQLAGWRILSVREEEEWRGNDTGFFRHTAVVAQKSEDDVR